MEVQCTPLGWPHFCQQEEMEELRHTLLYTTMELQTTIQSSKQEIASREAEMLQMRNLLNKTIKERDEAQAQCQKLSIDNLFLQQQATKKDQSDDDTKETQPEEVLKMAAKRPLPAKGKLLQAVMEAGPLLKTLLLAGALPRWQHPPPRLDSIEIPPITISSSPSSSSSSSSPTTPLVLSCFSKKRGPMPQCHGSKYPKIVLH